MTPPAADAPGLGEVLLIRPVTQDDVQCPAGTAVGGDGCVCAIERLRIDGRRNPDSIQAFCLGEYTACPTWRAERDRIDAGEKTELVDRKPIDHADVRARVERMHERRERARDLLTSDTEEGRQHRARLARILGPGNPFLSKQPTTAKERAEFARQIAGVQGG